MALERSLTNTVKTELAKDSLTPIHLLEIVLDSGTIYLTDAYKPLSWSAHTYTALGHLLQFDRVEETAVMQVNNTTIVLSGVDQTMYALFLGEHYVNRKAAIYLGFLDSTGALLVDPVKILDGRLDEPFIDEDPDSGTATVGVRVINQWSDYERINGRQANHNSQKHLFSDDKGFVHAHKVEQPITWGRRT